VKMRFTLNAANASIKGGVINCGRSMVNIATDFKDGAYETSDPVAQQVLAEYRGKSGRVFDSLVVMDDGTTRAADLEPIPVKVPPREASEVAAEREGKSPPTPGGPGQEDAGFAALPDAELRTLIQGHGLPVPASASHDELVQILDSATASTQQ
jgi:hypothetical protein